MCSTRTTWPPHALRSGAFSECVSGLVAARRWAGAVVGLSCVLFLAGCAGYRLGPTQGRQAGARSIQINPFVNKTMEPRLTESVTLCLRRQLQQDGTFQLDTGKEGDIVVNGTIEDFNRSGLTFLPGDTRTVQDYRISIGVQVVAKERATGRVLLNRRVSGQSTIRVGNDLVSAERQAVPLVAEDLARNVTGLLVDGSW